jgi:hypothetical protein
MFANVRINRPLQQNIEARANHKVFLKSFGVPSAMEKKSFTDLSVVGTSLYHNIP